MKMTSKITKIFSFEVDGKICYQAEVVTNDSMPGSVSDIYNRFPGAEVGDSIVAEVEIVESMSNSAFKMYRNLSEHLIKHNA